MFGQIVQSELMAVMVGDDGRLVALDGAQANEQYQLSYNARTGYVAKKGKII